MTRAIILATVLLLGGLLPVHAHKPSDSYLKLDLRAADVITGQWDIALRDLEAAIGLDRNADARITWAELLDAQTEIAAHVFARLSLSSNTGSCPLQLQDLLVDRHSDGPYAVLRFIAPCRLDEHPGLQLHYQLLFDIDPSHRGLVSVQTHNHSHLTVLSPDSPRLRLTDDQAMTLSLATEVGVFLWEGMWHIWIGFDHLLFLACLLLPAVMRRDTRRWVGVDSVGQALGPLLLIITAFTLAHTITLSLAVLEIVQLPSRWVESGIAASIIVVAALNLSPALRSRWRHDRWIIAFAFGLLHGFGFAGVLQDMQLATGSLATPLISFNIGVELGQIAAIAAAFPLAYALRNSRFYQIGILGAGTIIIILLACLWLYQRAFLP